MNDGPTVTVRASDLELVLEVAALTEDLSANELIAITRVSQALKQALGAAGR